MPLFSSHCAQCIYLTIWVGGVAAAGAAAATDRVRSINLLKRPIGRRDLLGCHAFYLERAETSCDPSQAIIIRSDEFDPCHSMVDVAFGWGRETEV